MVEKICISIDAMGGDHAPQAIIDGMRMATERQLDARYLLFGDQARIVPLLPAGLSALCEVRHTDQVVAADARPGQALRRGAGTSMRLAINAVRDGEAGAVVSAGNTGALMAMSKAALKTLPGVYRPAIVSKIPTLKGDSIMLDLGANIQCDENTLAQFAVMGADYAKTVLQVPRPRVGLLNVGEEELKGNDTIRAAHEILRNADGIAFDYHGFVEGTDITKGTVDVVVTDGFTGNVALKAMEGTARLFAETLGLAFRSSWITRLSYLLARGSIKKMRARLEPSNYNGAVFLGLNGIAVKSHGSADANGFANAIGIAVNMVADNMLEHLRADFEAFAPGIPTPCRAAAAGGSV